MFDSVKAVDGDFLLDKSIDLLESKDAESDNYFRPSQFCLLTSNGHKYGPYGTDSLKRKQVTKTIDRGDVLTHADKFFKDKFFKDKFFDFNVSFFSMPT